MGISHSEAYAAAGVNIEAGYEGVKLMKKHVQRTMIPGVVSDIGGFGGLFAPDLTGMSEPVLVSGTDGVGTKQRIAQLMNKHDSVGIDCVAMCVNDIICCGAKPIFFLDYIAIGKTSRRRSRRSSPAWRRAACSPAARSSAARPPNTPAPCLPTTTTLRASPSALSTARRSSTTTACVRATL